MSWVPAEAWQDMAEKALDRQRLDSEQRKAQPCDNCGEVGRTKATDWKGGVDHVWCHDDDKSCYGYATNPDRVVTFLSREQWDEMHAAVTAVPQGFIERATELRKKWMR